MEDYEKKERRLTGILKIENILYKILPHNLFVYIYGIGFRNYLKKTNKKLISDENIKDIN